jgi:predicted ABC-type ATPase
MKRGPRLYIIAGPNGAGKTTFARQFLPRYADCPEFVNADLIAHELSPRSPETAALRAGRLMLEQIHTLSRRNQDFGFETTLSGATYLPLLRRLKTQGYAIHLFFLWIPNAELALARVADRVRQGGHDIPETVVRRRFGRGLRNFFQKYCPLVDSWILFNNSTETPQVIASKEGGKTAVVNQELFVKLTA